MVANILGVHVQIYNFGHSYERPLQHLIDDSLTMIVSSTIKLDRNIYGRYCANYNIFIADARRAVAAMAVVRGGG